VARFTLVPKDQEFFSLFDEAGANIARAADLLDELMRSWPDRQELQREILICEQEGDRITHDIIHRLNTTPKGAPIDRQDIHALAGALDDVVDYIEETGDFMGLYKIEAPMEQAVQLTGVLKETCRNLQEALGRLRGMGDLRHFFVEVNRLENEGDRLNREALASLFEGGIDPVVIIRWKDVFDRLEAAIDACEHASHILEGIVVRHA
jgi:predicted phosphate transport protein (TIGR00153 family)